MASPREEVSLAHHGVLFLDEALEFHARNVLEKLQEPLEAGKIAVARAATTITILLL